MAINPKHNPDTQEGRAQPKKILTTAKGASTSMTNALKMLVERTKEIVRQVSGLTIEDTLKDCFLVFCFDGAVHENTSSINKT